MLAVCIHEHEKRLPDLRPILHFLEETPPLGRDRRLVEAVGWTRLSPVGWRKLCAIQPSKIESAKDTRRSGRFPCASFA
jgi:hypothetical protein